MKNLITCLAILTLFFSQEVFAQKAGWLDSTFNEVGINITDVGGNDDEFFAEAIQPDGKIVAAGYSYDGDKNYEFVVARYFTNGTLDSTFGNDGIFSELIDDRSSNANAVAIQSDGKIIAGGFSHQPNTGDDFLLVRLKTNGTPDSTFGSNGIVTTDFQSLDDVINAIVLQPDGKIVAGGSSSNEATIDFALARYNPDGTLDADFDGDGKLTTNIGIRNSEVASVVRQADGKIIAGGYSENQLDADFTVARYKTNGTLDSTFNSTGIVITDIDGYEEKINSLALQTNGKIIAGGSANNDSNDDFCVARYNSNGSLDSTFDEDGKLITDFLDNDDNVLSVVIQPDGKIIASGYTLEFDEQILFALARYNSTGGLDSSFGNAGLITTDINQDYDEIFASALQTDGKIVVSGASRSGNYFDCVVARYLTSASTGVLDFNSAPNSYLIYPNPVSETTRLEYELKNAETISVQLFDLSGRLINTIINNEKQASGKHEVNIPFSDQQATGTYIVRIVSANGQAGIKMVKE